jgi:hypothetical protein
MTLRQIAQRYIDAGFAVVPIPAGQKAATGSWNVTTYAADDITEGVALKCGAPSGDRVCVDCDTEAATAVAQRLLPRTACEGRKSRPSSHWWYLSPAAKHLTFKGLKNDQGKQQTIIEILATGNYALVPPTVHPSGEPREWDTEGSILDIPFDDLRLSVTAVAAACLIAEHWPGHGARHDARLALAGYLKRVGLPDGLIRETGRAIETLTNGDLNDWAAACSSTLSSTGRTTGGPKLAEHLERGREVVALLNKWFKIERATDARPLRFTPAASIAPLPVTWAWQHRVPAGTFGLLAGREGLGKSLSAISLIAQLTRGTLEGVHYGDPKSVIITASEDSWAHVLVPRLMVAGADLTKVFQVEAETPDGLADLSLPRDLAALQQAILDRGDVALILLDPLLSRLGADLDSHKDAEVRRALEPLVRLADATGVSVVGIIHVNKSQTADPLNAVMGSRAFAAVARFVLFVCQDPNDESIRLFGQAKSNLGAPQPTLTFEVKTATVTTPTGDIEQGHVVWTGEDPRTIRELLQEGQKTMTPRSANAAPTAVWLQQYLNQNGGAAESATVIAAAKAASHSERHLRQARKDLGITFHSAGFPRKTWWALPGATVNLTHLAGQP